MIGRISSILMEVVSRLRPGDVTLLGDDVSSFDDVRGPTESETSSSETKEMRVNEQAAFTFYK